MSTLESKLEQKRSADNYDYETNHFTEAINERQYVAPPQVGDVAPSFSLPDEHGDLMSLEDMLKEGAVIMSFFKGDWCNYCDLELKALQRALPEFQKLGARVFGISPHTVSISYMLKEKKELSYSILSDAGNEIAYRYGLRFPCTDTLLGVFESFGLSDMSPLHGDQGDNTNTLPIPGTFIIAPNGKIVFSFVDSDHTKRAEPADMIAVLMSINA